jgi:YVTN family beta-propeller protein
MARLNRCALRVSLVLFVAIPRLLRAAPFAYVTNMGDNTVSVIDTDTNRVVATVPVGPVPYGVAVDPRGDRVYISNQGDGSVSVIDTVHNAVTATVPGAGGFGIAVTPDGSEVYVAKPTGYQQPVMLTVIATATNQITATVDLGVMGVMGYGDFWLPVTASPDGTMVFTVTSLDTEQFPCRFGLEGCRLIVHTVATATREVSTDLIGGLIAGEPTYLVVSPDNTRLYVTAQTEDGRVPFFELPYYVGGGFIDLHGDGFGIAVSPSGDRLYIADEALKVIDATQSHTLPIIATVSVGSGPLGVALTPDGRRVYVVNRNDDSVSVADTETNSVIATIPVGHRPIAFGQFVGPATTITPAATPTPTVTPTATMTQIPPPCPGDCNGDDMVGVDELVIGVGIALGVRPVTNCFAFDVDLNMQVTVDELVAAVSHALTGC